MKRLSRFQAKKSEKHVEKKKFHAVSKSLFSTKREQFLRFLFRFRPWCPLLSVRTEKRLGRFQAGNGGEALKRGIFPVLEAVLGETPAEQI